MRLGNLCSATATMDTQTCQIKSRAKRSAGEDGGSRVVGPPQHSDQGMFGSVPLRAADVGGRPPKSPRWRVPRRVSEAAVKSSCGCKTGGGSPFGRLATVTVRSPNLAGQRYHRPTAISCCFRWTIRKKSPSPNRPKSSSPNEDPRVSVKAGNRNSTCWTRSWHYRKIESDR